MTFYPKRKVFISYYHGDQTAVNKFVQDFSDVFEINNACILRRNLLRYLLLAM